MSTPVSSSFSSAASVEAVLALMTSPRWAMLKAEQLHDGSRVVERDERTDGSVLYVLSRALPDGVPTSLQRFLPADGRAVQRDEWAPTADGERTGTWTVDLPGAPARLGGTMRLTPLPVGSRYRIEGQVTVRVPLIGGRTESYVAGLVAKLAVKEAQLLGSELGVEVSVST